ncbi:MAG: hypothetical protein HYT87_01010 [Nitrospirae bacterium]|nr:hypothetical protein [Nitrospirota bacterium]
MDGWEFKPLKFGTPLFLMMLIATPRAANSLVVSGGVHEYGIGDAETPPGIEKVMTLRAGLSVQPSKAALLGGFIDLGYTHLAGGMRILHPVAPVVVRGSDIHALDSNLGVQLSYRTVEILPFLRAGAGPALLFLEESNPASLIGFTSDPSSINGPVSPWGGGLPGFAGELAAGGGIVLGTGYSQRMGMSVSMTGGFEYEAHKLVRMSLPVTYRLILVDGDVYSKSWLVGLGVHYVFRSDAGE